MKLVLSGGVGVVVGQQDQILAFFSHHRLFDVFSLGSRSPLLL